MEPWYILILYFAIASFLGHFIWKFTEKIFFAKKKITKKKSNLLNGPISPLYGFAVLAVYFYNLYLSDLPLAIKIISYFFIPTIFEYSASVFLEKFLHIKLWDYKKCSFNIQGRICLWTSLLWFVLILLIVFVGQGFAFQILHMLPINLAKIFSIIFLVYLIINIFFSVRNHLKK